MPQLNSSHNHYKSDSHSGIKMYENNEQVSNWNGSIACACVYTATQAWYIIGFQIWMSQKMKVHVLKDDLIL